MLSRLIPSEKDSDLSVSIKSFLRPVFAAKTKASDFVIVFGITARFQRQNKMKTICKTCELQYRVNDEKTKKKC